MLTRLAKAIMGYPGTTEYHVGAALTLLACGAEYQVGKGYEFHFEAVHLCEECHSRMARTSLSL